MKKIICLMVVVFFVGNCWAMDNDSKSKSDYKCSKIESKKITPLESTATPGL